MKSCRPAARGAVKPGCKEHQNAALVKPCTGPLRLTAQQQLLRLLPGSFQCRRPGQAMKHPDSKSRAQTCRSWWASLAWRAPKPALCTQPSGKTQRHPSGTQRVSAASPGCQLQRKFYWRSSCSSEGVPCLWEPCQAPGWSPAVPPAPQEKIIAYPKDGE